MNGRSERPRWGVAKAHKDFREVLNYWKHFRLVALASFVVFSVAWWVIVTPGLAALGAGALMGVVGGAVGTVVLKVFYEPFTEVSVFEAGLKGYWGAGETFARWEAIESYRLVEFFGHRCFLFEVAGTSQVLSLAGEILSRPEFRQLIPDGLPDDHPLLVAIASEREKRGAASVVRGSA